MPTKSPAGKKPATKAPTRRSPITRVEGERRLIEAAASLLHSRPFSSVGVRDIATLADVNQGFIHTWFGSQSGLYLRVVQESFESMLANIEHRPPEAIALNPLDAEVQFAVRLLFWLDLDGVDIMAVKPQLDILMKAFSQRLIDLMGLPQEIVESVTMQGSAIGLGMAAFGHLIGANDAVKFSQAVSVWRRQLELLAQHSVT